MAQILDPLPPDSQNNILCCYVNATSKVQVARISNIPNWYFERVVFPGQRLVFETIPEALLEIHSGMMASAILSDKIPCDRLRVNEEPSEDASPIQRPLEEETKKLPKREPINNTVEKTTFFSNPVLAIAK
ncbi:MAG TPA: DUF1830 domain-containing protein [Leptolyngbyaceae cyanobacterium]